MKVIPTDELLIYIVSYYFLVICVTKHNLITNQVSVNLRLLITLSQINSKKFFDKVYSKDFIMEETFENIVELLNIV